MRRWSLIIWAALAPSLVMVLACSEQETRIETRTERIEESEPRTVSPGEPIVE